MEDAAVFQVDRSLGNKKFESWRLTSSLLDCRSVSRTKLKGSAALICTGATDYLRTRSSVLHNSLISSAGHLFLFLQQGEDLTLNEVSVTAEGAAAVAPLVALPSCRAALTDRGGLCSPGLSCTCTQVEGPTEGRWLVISSGQGDLTLAFQTGDGCWRLSNTVFPVPAAAPLIAVHPFMIRAATTAGGKLKVVLVTILDKTERHEAGCEVRVSLLQVSDSRSISLASEARRYYISSLPPHAVVVGTEDAGEGLVLLAVTPGHSLQDLHQGEAPDHRGLGLSQGSGDALGPGKDSDDDDVDPVLLEAANARLAHMTSETQVEDPPAYQAADVFKEGGPEGLGEMGGEPPCDLLLFRMGSAQEAQRPTLLSRVALSPHSVMAAQQGLPFMHGSSCILGVTDDVDCAVAEISIKATTPASFEAKHVATLPALAYLAAGKQQKKFLLLSGSRRGEGRPACAALVESTKYAYVYGWAAPGGRHAPQQVVDLESEEGGVVTDVVEGAQLWEVEGKQYVLLLTSTLLVCLPLVCSEHR